MDLEQFTAIKKLLEEIRDLLKEDKQPQTKITVVGNKPQTQVPKGLKSDEDFVF
jgi:dihydroneopterin aldolase